MNTGMLTTTTAVEAIDQDDFAVPSLIDGRQLPPGTRCVELHTNSVDLRRYLELDSSEQELVAGAVDRRKSDFGDSRWCAHRAMSHFSVDRPILRGERGVPVFPHGITGSITHTNGFRAAVVGRTRHWMTLGIDAEPAVTLPRGVFDTIARRDEQRRLGTLMRRMDQPLLDTVLFSAKEATYKAWFPLTHRFLDFDQADIDIRPDGTFTSYILARPTPVPMVEGRWIIKDGFVVTLAGVGASRRK